MQAVSFGQSAEIFQAFRAYTLIGTGTTTGAITVPKPSKVLRKMVLGVSENATLGTAGITQFTLALNGITVFSEGFYLPSAPGSQAGQAYHRDVPFDDIGFVVNNGNATWSLSTALTAGQMDINLYFS